MLRVPFIIHDENGIQHTYTCGITHSTKFHSDDVFAAALLNMIAFSIHGMYPPYNMKPFDDMEFPIRRLHPDAVARDFSNSTTDFIFDVGNGKYDHHLSPRETRENGVPYSSFGKIWRDFSHLLGIGELFQDIFDRDFVQVIDLNDNEGVPNIMSTTIAMMNGVDPKHDEMQDLMFKRAVRWAYDVLDIHIRNLLKQQDNAVKLLSADGILCTNIYGCDYVMFDKYVNPYELDDLFKTALVTVYPHNRGGWAVQTLRDHISMSDIRNRWSAPDWYRGKTPEELQKMPGAPRFCHASGFLMVFDKKEDCMRYVEYEMGQPLMPC